MKRLGISELSPELILELFDSLVSIPHSPGYLESSVAIEMML